MATYNTGVITLGNDYSITSNIGNLNWNNNDKVNITIRAPKPLVYPDFWPGTVEIERVSTSLASLSGATAGNGSTNHGGTVGYHYISVNMTEALSTILGPIGTNSYYDKTFTLERGIAIGAGKLILEGAAAGTKDFISGQTYTTEIDFTWADGVPNNFSFSPKVNASPGTTYYDFTNLYGFSTTESVIVTSGSITTAVTSATGSLPSSSSFNSSAKNISSGQRLWVKMTASTSFDSSVFGTVSVNGVSATWTVTTGAQDVLPNVYTFGANITGAAVGSYHYSSARILGFTGTLQAASDSTSFRGTVPDLQWDVSNSSSLSGVQFQSQPHNITSGQYLHVRVRAGNAGTTTGGVMKVGNRAASWFVTTVDVDSIPDSFSFTNITGAALNYTFYRSAQITGINSAALVSVFGGSTIQYATSATNSQPSSSSFGNGPGSIEPNHYLWVRLTSSNAFDSTISGLISVGGIGTLWNITTRSPDITPTNFSFPSVTNAVTSSFVFTKVQVTGVENSYPVPVSITGGVSGFAVSSSTSLPANSAFTSNPKTVQNNQYVWVSLKASDSVSSTTSTSVTIGSLTRTFTVTTAATTAPGDTTSPGSGGTATPGSGAAQEGYGLIVYGIDGSTPVFGLDRTASLQVDETFSLAGGQSHTFACANANDSSKVLIEIKVNGAGINIGRQDDVTVSKNATNFSITNTSSQTRSGRVIANRIS